MVAFSPYGTLTLALPNNAVASGALPLGASSVVVSSSGTAPVWLTFSKGAGGALAGVSPVVGNSYPLFPGQTVLLGCGGADTVNALTASACNLYVIAGTGDFGGFGVGSGGTGGSGGNVNLTQVGGAPISLGATTSVNSLPMAPATDATFVMSGSVSASGTMVLGAGAANVGNVGLLAGTNVVGKFAIDQTTPGTSNAVSFGANATGAGAMLVSSVIISSTTATVIKASPGTFYGYSIDNNSAGPVYAKYYNATSATVGVGAPAVRLMCPGPTNGGGATRDWSHTIGYGFLTGLCLIVTQNQADNDTVAVPTGTVTVNTWYR